MLLYKIGLVILDEIDAIKHSVKPEFLPSGFIFGIARQ
jgi:hypothetical protein